MKKILSHVYGYFEMFWGMFSKPENFKVYWKELVKQCYDIGIGAFGIVFTISAFLGAVTTIQTAYQLISPFIPRSVIATIVRDSSILELSPTVVCIVLAGVVGSKISSELGNMRITEQIDALEIMGINSKTYLILPKIIASIIMIPLLIIISIFICNVGGYMAAVYTGLVSKTAYIQGLLDDFINFNVIFATIKAFTFAFLISSISCYFGFNVKGGAFEIGRASTTSVIVSCVAILFADYFLATILL